MFKRFAAAVLLFFGLAVGIPLFTSAPASAATCSANATAPVWSSSYMVARGTASCSVAGDIDVEVSLERDGTDVDYNAASCWGGYKTCAATAASPNLAGDQHWCTYVVVWFDGYVVDENYLCENTGY